MHNCTSLLQTLMFAEQQFWIFHIQTKSFSEHKALDKVYTVIGEYKDKLAERLGSLMPDCIEQLGTSEPIRLNNYVDKSDVVEELNALIDTLVTVFNEDVEEEEGVPSDILNLRDELVSELRQGVYMLTRLS